jgi:hypothetical protein
MKNFIFILLFLTTLAEKAQGTYSVNGTVTDEKGETLPGATVFIGNTQKATSTDGSGKFILDGLQPGTYDVSVKMLGFNLYSKPVVIQKASVILDVPLKENNIQLKTVNISGTSDEMRARLLETFLKTLLGQSPYAKECKLLNPDAVNLNFEKREGRLEASSDEFLTIENKALGYTIHYLITRFEKTFFRNMVFYDGALYFEELKGTRSEQKKWAKNRQLAYEGSITHFFRSVFTNTISENRFTVYRFLDDAAIKDHAKNEEKIKHEYFSPFKIPGDWFTNQDENNKLLNLRELKKDSTELYIIYSGRRKPGEDAPALHLPPFINKPAGQASIIHPLLDSVLINRDGNINPSNSLLHMGYWAWGGAADFLPSDYGVIKD